MRTQSTAGGVSVLIHLMFAALSSISSGCADKETVIDVETPAGQVEVERDRDTGEVDVEVTDNNP